MEDSGPSVTVRILFSERGALRARRGWSLGLVEEKPVEGGVLFTLSAGRLEWFVNWLLSFGPWATVIEPPGLRDLLVSAAEAAAAHHRTQPKGS